MNLYLIVWLLICFFAIKDFAFKSSQKTREIEFAILILILSFMLIFRFGQGTDYFGYRYNYNSLSAEKIDFAVMRHVHGEFGFLLLCNLFRVLKAPFELLVACTAACEMWCFCRFCVYFKIDNALVLVLAYPTLYMTYFVSSLRQGIIMAVFLGVLLPMFLNKKYGQYIIVMILCATIHSSALFFLLNFVLIKIKRTKTVWLCCFLSWVTGIILTLPALRNILISLGIEAINYYIEDGGSGISITTICERLFFLGLVTWVYLALKRKEEVTPVYQKIYCIYLVAMSLYGLFIWDTFLASRFCSVMRPVELYLLVIGNEKLKLEIQRVLFYFLVALESMMFIKNINSYIIQGNYRENTTILSYKYVSIFNEKEIFEIRDVRRAYIMENEIEEK